MKYQFMKLQWINQQYLKKTDGQRLAALAGIHLEALELQGEGERAADRRVVIDDDDEGTGGRGDNWVHAGLDRRIAGARP